MSDYKRIGDFIRLVDERNRDLEINILLGLSITKEFISSVANTVGSNMRNYKIIRKNQFACSLMQVRRDKKIPVAILKEYDQAIISQAYPVFEIIDENLLLPDYLMMWMSREEFDREACFYAVGGVRGSLEWEDFCNMQLPVPSIETQRKIVAEYNSVKNRINLNNQLIQKLEETAQEVFNECFNQPGENGKLTRLGDIIEIRGGFSYHSSNLAKGSSYLLGMGCISFSSRFLEEGLRLYSDEHPVKHRVKPRDIVIATRQQSDNMPILGYPAMIPLDLEGEKLIVASNLYRVDNKSNWSNEVLYQLLRSPEYHEHIRLNTKGTTVGMITKDAIEDFYFQAPTNESVNQLQSELKTIVNLIFIKRKETKSLLAMKETLLSRITKVEPKKEREVV